MSPDNFQQNNQSLSSLIDPEISSIKKLVDKLVNTNDSQMNNQTFQMQKQINHMDHIIRDLTNRLANTQQQLHQCSSDLRKQRELRKQDLDYHQQSIRLIKQQTSAPIFFSPKIDSHKEKGARASQSPGRRLDDSIRRTNTPIHDLLDIRHSQPTKDQVHRLNSYLIENTTAIKLLSQKHNYLLRLRGMGQVNRDQELEVIVKSKRVLEDRRTVDEARHLLQNSKKRYFVQDGSGSEIENQHQGLPLK